ncbi:reverse transcriptase domain-containing protein [Tanacetum coccineum]
MSAMVNVTPIVTTVTKNANNEKVPDAASRVNILDFCEEHYEDILPIIMEKARRDKRKEVQTRLNFRENHKKTRRERENSLNSRTEYSPTRFHPRIFRTRGREKRDDRNVFNRLSHRRKSVHERLSDTYSSSATKFGPSRTDSRDLSHSRGHSLSREHPRIKDGFRGVEESVKRWRESESPSSESNTSNGGHWKSRTKRRNLVDEDDLAVPWTCEDVDPFTPRIYKFKSSRKTHMPNNVKTYDRTGDLEDHLYIFQAAEQVECWAMPTWCHMFNSTLIGAARVWFDELPPESIDGYKGLKAALLAYFMQQKKYVKDPVEIHNIKQRDGETIEDFMELFKVETGPMKGAPECMRISGFMHGVNNPKLTKCLNEHVPKTMEEMMTVTIAFIRREAVATSKKKGHLPWKSQDQSKRHASERRSDFRCQSREGQGSNKFTPLTRTPKEILTAKAGKFKPPPPMVTLAEKRSSKKFCDFHNDKGHSTDECMQLKKQIKELVRAGKLSHLIKEIKQGRDQTKNGKKEAPAKDKSLAIYMIQPWQRMTRQKLTQSFARSNEIMLPPLANSDGIEGPLVIEAEIGRHMIHRSFNKFTWYKNEALYTRIAAYSDQTRPNLTFVSTSWRHPWYPTLGITLIRMSTMANATPIVTIVTKNANNEKAPDAASRVNILDFCEEHYEDILPIIMEKARESPSLESSTSNGGHWKSRTKRRNLVDEDDLAVPWTCEDEDPFTSRIRNFKSSRKTCMPNIVKTYDRTGDPEDHLKIFQAAAQVERWAMPTWCHMFNSTLIGVARVWFDELPPESIDGYKGLKAAFLAYFMQQKKYVKDLVEIHNIKQRDGEAIEDFIERFKVETGRMKGAPECMQISGFMHGVNNPKLIKRLNEHVPKTMEEMMTVTTAFIRGEAAAASKKKCHLPWKSQDQSKRHASERRSDF